MNSIPSTENISQVNSLDSGIYSEIEENLKLDQDKIEKDLQEKLNRSRKGQQNLENSKKFRELKDLLDNKQKFIPKVLVNSKTSMGSNIRTLSDYINPESKNDSAETQFKPFTINGKPEKINENSKFVLEKMKPFEKTSPFNVSDSQNFKKNTIERKIDPLTSKDLKHVEHDRKNQSISEHNIRDRMQELQMKEHSIYEETKTAKMSDQLDSDPKTKNTVKKVEEENSIKNNLNILHKQNNSDLKNIKIFNPSKTERNFKLATSNNESEFLPKNHLVIEEQKNGPITLKLNDKNDFLPENLIQRSNNPNDVTLKMLFEHNKIELITENDLLGIERIKYLTKELLMSIFIRQKNNPNFSDPNQPLLKILTNHVNLGIVTNFTSKIVSLFSCECNSLKILIFVAHQLNLKNLAYTMQADYNIHDEENSELLAYYYLHALKGDIIPFKNYLVEKASRININFEDLCEILNNQSISEISNSD